MGSHLLCGPIYQPLGVFTGKGPSEDEKTWAAEVNRRAAVMAMEADVLLAVEYVARFAVHFLTSMDETAKHVRRVAHPNFLAMYDTHHANVEEKDPAGAIRRHADVIAHVHISENDRGIPGRGHIDWPGTFRALRSTGYQRWLTVEAFGRQCAEWAATSQTWRDYFSSYEEVYTESVGFVRDQWEAAALTCVHG